jgi:polyisoprenoid-binding protein YceI
MKGYQRFNFKKLYQFAIVLMLVLMSSVAESAPITWKIDPSSSSLVFIGTKNGLPFSGLFKNFDGVIHFSPDNLNTSDVTINMDIDSITTPLEAATAMLKSVDWFNVRQYPKATYVVRAFNQIDAENYLAQGLLTIRERSVPVMVQFNWHDITPTTALVRGAASVKRSAFGVGASESATAEHIKDDVNINFSLSLHKSKIE